MDVLNIRKLHELPNEKTLSPPESKGRKWCELFRHYALLRVPALHHVQIWYECFAKAKQFQKFDCRIRATGTQELIEFTN